MSQPWFPFYVGDYLRDTARLTTEAHGAYLLLILDYWANGAPPDDDDTLSSIARLSPPAWLAMRQRVAPFFVIEDGVWRHGRIEKELRIAAEKHQKRVDAGRSGGKAKAKGKQSSSNATSNAPSKTEALPYQPQPQPQSHIGGGLGRAREAGSSSPPAGKSPISDEAYAIAKQVIAAMGKDEDDPASYAAPLTVQSWLNGGWNAECILVGVKRGMQSRNGEAPSNLKYFEKAIARAHAELTAPVPVAELRPAETFLAAAPRARPKTDFQRRQEETNALRQMLRESDAEDRRREAGGLLRGDHGERSAGLPSGTGGRVLALPVASSGEGD
jgi:uncharacterized protein YdaU (DUF1376 family)